MYKLNNDSFICNNFISLTTLVKLMFVMLLGVSLSTVVLNSRDLQGNMASVKTHLDK